MILRFFKIILIIIYICLATVELVNNSQLDDDVLNCDDWSLDISIIGRDWKNDAAVRDFWYLEISWITNSAHILANWATPIENLPSAAIGLQQQHEMIRIGN